MRQYKVSKLVLVVAVFAIILFITAGFFYLGPSNRESTTSSEEESSISNSSLNKEVQSATSTVANPTSPVTSPSIQTEETKWETYQDENFKFVIRYPKKGWVITSKVGKSALPYTALQEPINLYTARDIHEQGPISAPITITVYEKPSTNLIEWLSKGYGTDLSQVARGRVDTTLAKAYDFENGVVTYNEFQKNSAFVYEVGRVWDNYSIYYETFFVKETLPYVYEVNFRLPHYGPEWNADPSDSEYIETYKQIISTFQFVE